MRRCVLLLAMFLLLIARRTTSQVVQTTSQVVQTTSQVVQIPQTLYQQGIRAAMEGNPQKANAMLSRAAAQQPKESEGYFIHYWLGVVRAALGDKEGALKEWRESAREGFSRDKTDVLERIKVAEGEQQQMIEHDPTAPAIRAMSRAEHAEKSARFLRAKDTPSFHKATAAMQQAQTLQAQGKFTEAANVADQASQLYTQAQAEPHAAETAAVVTSTASQSNPDASLFDEIDRRFAELSPGEIVFTAPDKMRVAETSEVDLRIAAKNHSSGILDGLTEGVTSTAAQEHITPVMEAHLDGGSGLDIASVGKDSQSVAGGGFAEWRWNVTPKRSGSQRLTVSIIAHLTYPDGRDIPKTIRTMTRTVEVSANVGDSVKGFFASYWQWLTTTLIIPIVIFIYRRRTKTT
jgi:uncharacterized cupredoxin-like copper-binding protein